MLKAFADAVINGGELLARGEEGINGLTMSNAIHLSSWTGETIELKNMDEDKFYEILQDKIKNSTHKKTIRKQYADTEGTYR